MLFRSRYQDIKACATEFRCFAIPASASHTSKYKHCVQEVGGGGRISQLSLAAPVRYCAKQPSRKEERLNAKEKKKNFSRHCARTGNIMPWRQRYFGKLSKKKTNLISLLYHTYNSQGPPSPNRLPIKSSQALILLLCLPTTTTAINLLCAVLGAHYDIEVEIDRE